MEQKGKRSKKKLWTILYVLLILGCLISIGGMFLYMKEDKRQEEVAVEVQKEIEEQYVNEEADPVLAELPIDFKGLQEENPEIYAWLEVPDTNINYPILQHEGEDQSYYLTRDLNGEKNQAGSIYTEDYNNKDFQDYHTVLYGHNMKNGSMFHNVRYFADREFFEEHRELYVYMPEKILKYEIIACYEYDDRHLLGMFDYDDMEAYGEYLEEIMNPRSMYAMIREGWELDTDDKLLTLSTCIANKPNNRRLLQAVLVEEVDAEYKGAVNELTDKTKN